MFAIDTVVGNRGRLMTAPHGTAVNAIIIIIRRTIIIAITHHIPVRASVSGASTKEAGPTQNKSYQQVLPKQLLQGLGFMVLGLRGARASTPQQQGGQERQAHSNSHHGLSP